MVTVISHRALLVALITGLVGCGGASDSPAQSQSASGTSSSSSSASSSSTSSSSSSSGTLEPPQEFTVVTTSGEGGSLTPSSAVVEENEVVSFSIAADAGFTVASVSGCNGSLSGSDFTTGSITGDCEVSAQFEPLLFTVSGTVLGLDGVLVLSYQSDAGSHLLELSENGPFTLSRQAQLGYEYQVSVHAQPTDQVCSVTHGSAIVVGDMNEVSVSCETLIPPARVSGIVSANLGIAVDSSINDIAAYYADNSTPASAQVLYHQATLQGFASAEPTGGSATYERFAIEANPNDFYRVVLEAGQTVQLHVVDHDGLLKGGRFEGDLDLYMFDADYNLIGVSDSATEFEEITVASSQEYFLNVHAAAGISKYVLRLFPAPATTSASTAETVPEFVPNEMIVKYREVISTKPLGRDMPPAQALARSTKLSTALAQLTPGAGLEQLKLRNPGAFDKVMTLRSVKEMRSREDVVYAEPNYIRGSLLAPDDKHYPLQWHYTAIGMPDAWSVTTGTGTERDVVVAVIDTGVLLAHPDMSGQLITGYDFISDAVRARDGDGIDGNPDDVGDSDTQGASSWHGTHVAGTAAAASNNAVGGAGVAWGAKIMPLRVLGKGGGTSYDIIQALRYAGGLANDSGTVPAQRADIANLSFGGLHGSAAEQEAYAQVRAAGVILVGAAGNNNSSEAFYPAAYPEVISVSATDYRNKRAPYSNYGATIAVAAPGGNNAADLNSDGYPDGILSTSADDSNVDMKYVYRFHNGTSMAAPHVAGVMALMKAVYPQLSPDQVDALLQNGSLTDDLGAAGRDDIYGHGLINAFKAVQVATELASGSEPRPAEADVMASPGEVNLGYLSTASVTLANYGGGTPRVSSVGVSDLWLTVAAETVDEYGLGEYTIVVDRQHLVTGVYQGEIIFSLDDGATVVVSVSIQVNSAASEGTLGRTYVLLIDSHTGDLVDQAVIEGGTGSAAYAFEEVAAGEYRIVAGSDIDADNYICTFGETCGKYPYMDHPQNVGVSGVDVTGVDFTVDVLSALAESLGDVSVLKSE